MGTSPINPIDLMVQVIEEHSPESIWQNSPLAGYRQLGNTNRGQIGKDSLRMARRYWEAKEVHDDLDTEIQRKFNRGHPRDNILFEDFRLNVYQNRWRSSVSTLGNALERA